MRRPLPTADGIAKALAERSLRHFIEKGWRYIDPAKYKGNWHIDAMAEHLEAVARGQIRNLIINVPPRHMKSLSVSVAFPAWVWAQRENPDMPLMGPHARFLATSYAQSLSVRDNTKCRRLITSPWYQANWGDRFSLSDDQNTKIRFENDKQGYRIASSRDGTATGEGGDIIIIDDPSSAQDANSETERANVITWFDETMSTRLNDPETGAYVLIMQRLHERDLVGHVLEQAREDWEVLCLPARYEPDHKLVWARDPRTELGQLIWPERVGEQALSKIERALGSYGTAGQLQQRPAPRSGGMFDRTNFKFLPALPNGPHSTCRAWDFAATEPKPGTKPDWSAGAKLHRFAGAEIEYVLEGMQRFQASPATVEKTVKQTAELDTTAVTVRIPQDPGQAGKAQAQAYVRLLAGWIIKAVPPTGDKTTRATPFSAQVEIGNVAIIRTGDPDRDAWIEPFLSEIEVFPAGANDDQVDAVADAFNELAPTGGAEAWIKFLDEQLAAVNGEQKPNEDQAQNA